jgi:RiboL-PSP-HEPN
MASKAHENLGRRMNDIQQLIEAHTALTQFQRARKAAEEAGGGLKKISVVVDNLVSAPKQGRRTEVDAINRAAMVLLTAHLQGYIEDLYAESAKALLSGSVKDVNALTSRGLSGFSNPHAYRIDGLFASVGLRNSTSGISWQRASNKSIKKRLTMYIQERNAIAHGKKNRVHKAKVIAYKKFVEVFAEHFDDKIARALGTTLGHAPW